MSQYAAEFFRDIPNLLGDVDLQFTPHGYLLLGTEKTADQLEQNYKLQQSLKVKNLLLTPKELKTRFPWLNTDDIVCGIVLSFYNWLLILINSSYLQAVKKIVYLYVTQELINPNI